MERYRFWKQNREPWSVRPFVCSSVMLFQFMHQESSSVKKSVQRVIKSHQESSKRQNQASKSSVKIKCQNQASKSSVKIKCQIQASKYCFAAILNKAFCSPTTPPPISVIKHPKYCFMVQLLTLLWTGGGAHCTPP